MKNIIITLALLFSYVGYSQYINEYPPAYSDTYVKTTTKFSTDFWGYYATNPANSVIGNWASNAWASVNGTNTNQRLHIDLGTTRVIKRIYYENGHTSGTYTLTGIKNFTIWGSNEASAFSNLTYGTDTDWNELTPSQYTFDEHIASNVADPKYITITNTTAYRYYAIKIADNWGHVTGMYMTLRKIVLQSETVIPSSVKGIITGGKQIITNGTGITR